jgi:hypothetical protein
MSDLKNPRTVFPLRLAASSRERAEEFAAAEAVSINNFINLAVAERVSRLESHMSTDSVPDDKQRGMGKQ